jgi:hypothetical protein
MNISSVRGSSSFYASQLMRQQTLQRGEKAGESQQSKKSPPVAQGDGDNDGGNLRSVNSSSDAARDISVNKSRESAQYTNTYNAQARISSSSSGESTQNSNAYSSQAQQNSSSNAASSQRTNGYNSQAQTNSGSVGSRIDIVA